MAYKKNPLKLADGTLTHVNMLVTICLWKITVICKITKVNVEQLGFRNNEVELLSCHGSKFYASSLMLSKANKEQRKQYYNELSKLNK